MRLAVSTLDDVGALTRLLTVAPVNGTDWLCHIIPTGTCCGDPRRMTESCLMTTTRGEGQSMAVNRLRGLTGMVRGGDGDRDRAGGSLRQSW